MCRPASMKYEVDTMGIFTRKKECCNGDDFLLDKLKRKLHPLGTHLMNFFYFTKMQGPNYSQARRYIIVYLQYILGYGISMLRPGNDTERL